jgi:hypothetical protein
MTGSPHEHDIVDGACVDPNCPEAQLAATRGAERMTAKTTTRAARGGNDSEGSQRRRPRAFSRAGAID